MSAMLSPHFISSNSWSMPGLEARALDAGVRGAAPLVRLARLRLPVSAPVSVASPPLPLTLREDRVELVVVRAQRDLNLHHGIPEDGAPSVEQNIEQHEPPLAPPVSKEHITVSCSHCRTSPSSLENRHLIKTSYKLANYTRLVCILQPR